MVMGLDPKKMAVVQEVSRHINGEIRINYPTQTVEIKLFSEVPAAVEIIPSLLDQFATALAAQLSSFFAIQGTIVEVGKKDAPGTSQPSN